MKDCTTCKYGYKDERLGIPMCHHPKRFSEDCVNFNMHEEKETEKSEKPINPEAAMKALDEKIALVKQRGTWDGVDVDKYMDEVRGREPEKHVPNDLDFEQALYNHFGQVKDFTLGMRIGQYFYELGKQSSSSETPNYLEEAAGEYEKNHTYQLYDGGGLTPEYDATLAESFIAGYNLCKEQMMKEAVEHYVIGEIAGSPVGPAIVHYDDNLNIGDKVRIIIVKED